MNSEEEYGYGEGVPTPAMIRALVTVALIMGVVLRFFSLALLLLTLDVS